MEKITENTYKQIAYDFKIFIRESLLYDYDANVLKEFADFMDSMYYPNFKLYNKWLSIPFINIDKIIIRDTFEMDLYDKCVSDKAHIDGINCFIRKYYEEHKLPMITNDDKIKSGICLFDYVVASSSVIFDWSKDNLKDFSKYMLEQYPDYPYKKVRKMISKLDNSERNTLTCVIDQNLCKFSDGSFGGYFISKDRLEYINRFYTGCFKSKKKTHR